MEIEENVNPGTERRLFSKIAFENRKKMQSQSVACDQQKSQIWREGGIPQEMSTKKAISLLTPTIACALFVTLW